MIIDFHSPLIWFIKLRGTLFWIWDDQYCLRFNDSNKSFTTTEIEYRWLTVEKTLLLHKFNKYFHETHKNYISVVNVVSILKNILNIYNSFSFSLDLIFQRITKITANHFENILKSIIHKKDNTLINSDTLIILTFLCVTVHTYLCRSRFPNSTWLPIVGQYQLLHCWSGGFDRSAASDRSRCWLFVFAAHRTCQQCPL